MGCNVRVQTYQSAMCESVRLSVHIKPGLITLQCLMHTLGGTI